MCARARVQLCATVWCCVWLLCNVRVIVSGPPVCVVRATVCVVSVCKHAGVASVPVECTAACICVCLVLVLMWLYYT